MGNKVKYNLKNIYAAVMTEAITDGISTFTYVTPKKIPGAVSLSLDSEGSNDSFKADGVTYFRANSNNGYSGDLEIALVPEWFRTEILQEKLDTNKVLIETNTSTETVKFALMFEFDGDVKAIRHVMYCCSATRPTISSDTNDDKITPNTEKLTLTVDPRSDGYVKAKTGDETTSAGYDAWFTTVYTPVPVTTP